MEEPEVKSSRYDVIVVGAGPAGISAAINVANRKRTVAVLDGSQPFSHTRRAHTIPNYPGFSYASGEQLAEAFTRHLTEFEVPLIREKASKIMSGDDGLIVFTESDMYHAGAVILATGVYREAELEGEEDLVGQGVSYCVTCDGRLFAGKEVAFVSYVAEGEQEAAALAEDYGTTVTYVPLYRGEYRLPPGVRILSRQRPDRLYRRDGRVHVRLPDEELTVDGVFVYKKSVSPRTLVDGLVVDGRHIEVDRRMWTGQPGIFAAGDCTGEPYQIAKAAGEGQVAALEAVRYLREGRHPEPTEPPVLKPEDRESLQRILRERLDRPVRLIHFTQLTGSDGEWSGPACGPCRETRRLLEEFVSLSPKLSLELHDLIKDAQLAQRLGVERIPATMPADQGDEHPRLRFYGLPAGYEFGALLEDVIQVSVGRDELAPQTVEALSELDHPVHLQVMTTPTCPYCPGAVRMAHRFALASPKVTADMVSVAEFPELAQRYDVESVPRLVVNGQVAPSGAVTEERLLDLVRAHGR